MYTLYLLGFLPIAPPPPSPDHHRTPSLAPCAYSSFLLAIFFIRRSAYMSALPWWLSGKESACSIGDAGDTGLIPGFGRSSGEGSDSPLQYSLGNPVDKGAWQAVVHGTALRARHNFRPNNSVYHLKICFCLFTEASWGLCSHGWAFPS